MDNLRYADDTTLIAKDEQEMSSLIERVERVCLEFGLQLNRQKTKLMLIDSMEEMPNIKDVENVEEITYLSAHISRNDGSSQEIRRRIALAKTAMTKLNKIWKDRKDHHRFSNAAESWTLKATDIPKLDAFEMWVWRRLLRIPWTNRRTDVSILEELNIQVRCQLKSNN